ncbi:protein involved in gliding motility GldI [Tenacibaculum adriaticum]|uniref:Peptidyl-prolyl cis-trans isomerase n=1 Tax=Tenacibaculum adriaticum TaxID=413713 RepID=A0A5S5DR72_9FLAO|nr:gliding motility-associated peptidyl-prolyl isomerase GldI [Tenacibaculum adriaticum]TYP98245.1 protein involved in gliding motility GldI [Tenacibaculum adriaticum]
MKRSIYILTGLVLLFSCKEPKVRKPKQHSTTNFYKEVLDQNKKLNELENKRIEYLISQDTLHQYKSSSNGFWYTFIQKDTINHVVPKENDLVTIQYTIQDVNGNPIYAKQERTYKVDKEDFIPGLQDGIKLMKEGETVTFIVPSYRAYGVVGDGNKIGINQPLKSTLTLIKIKQKTNENK